MEEKTTEKLTGTETELPAEKEVNTGRAAKKLKEKKTKKMSEIAILSAIIVVLTIICTFIKFGPFSITLALAPIIIGASLYGPGVGALLGGVFGAVVLLTGFAGWDGGVVMYLFSLNPLALVLGTLLKSVVAGYLAGLAYQMVEKKNPKLAVTVAGIVCPVVNTGIFILVMILFFMPALQEWAGGTNVIVYALFGMTGINFIVELLTNIVLSNAITAVIKYRKGRR